MSRRLVLYDDARARTMEPFALTRPAGEMRAGGMPVRSRWERLLGASASAFVGAPHLAAYDELGAPRAATGALPAGTVVANTRFACGLGPAMSRLAAGAAIAGPDGRVAAVALAASVPVARLADGTVALESLASRKGAVVPGWWIEETWDFVRLLPEMLAVDAGILSEGAPGTPPRGVAVLGEHPVAIARGAFVEPQVVFDTTAGAVVVEAGARIGAFARIAGPAVIGAHTHVAGGRYGCVSIGEHSKVCGEMSVVIGSGYSNKGHDGFIGHSVLGRWSNLGAGTITSNLKNSYGPIRVEDSRGGHETGMQFLGSLIGDHAKTAIGTRLGTGTIVGAGANVFGDRAPAKFVPPFAWGDVAPFVRYEREKFLDVAAHVMHRREIVMTAGMRASLGAAWDMTAAARRARPGNAGAAATRGKRR